jgi:DnaK suppressor protein
MTAQVNVSEGHGLDQEQLGLLQQRLIAEREELTRRLKERRQRLTELAVHRPDESDWASDSADQSLLARLVDRDAKLLIEVHRALEKMGAGTYGLCERTGEPIGFDRLRVRPWTRHSLAAKEVIERDRAEEGPEVIGDDDRRSA